MGQEPERGQDGRETRVQETSDGTQTLEKKRSEFEQILKVACRRLRVCRAVKARRLVGSWFCPQPLASPRTSVENPGGLLLPQGF